MRMISAFILALLLWTGAGNANRYSQPPAGGDCAAIAAKIGQAATWYGEFAGNWFDTFWNTREPISARGCFESERACRLWQYRAPSYLDRVETIYSFCRQGVAGY